MFSNQSSTCFLFEDYFFFWQSILGVWITIKRIQKADKKQANKQKQR